MDNAFIQKLVDELTEEVNETSDLSPTVTVNRTKLRQLLILLRGKADFTND